MPNSHKTGTFSLDSFQLGTGPVDFEVEATDINEAEPRGDLLQMMVYLTQNQDVLATTWRDAILKEMTGETKGIGNWWEDGLATINGEAERLGEQPVQTAEDLKSALGRVCSVEFRLSVAQLKQTTPCCIIHYDPWFETEHGFCILNTGKEYLYTHISPTAMGSG